MAKPTKPDQSKVLLNLDEKGIADVVAQFRKNQAKEPADLDLSEAALAAAEKAQEQELSRLLGRTPVADSGDDEGLERNWEQLKNRMAAQAQPSNPTQDAPVLKFQKRKRQHLWLGGLAAVAAVAFLGIVTTLSQHQVSDTTQTFKGIGAVSPIDCEVTWEDASGKAAPVGADLQTYQLTPQTAYHFTLKCSGDGFVHGVLTLNGKTLRDMRNMSLAKDNPLKVDSLVPNAWPEGSQATLALTVTEDRIGEVEPLLFDKDQTKARVLWSDTIPLTVLVGKP